MSQETPAGGEVPVAWRGRHVRAWVPALLAERDLTLAPATHALLGAAAEALASAAAELPADHAPLARLLLRSEGIASSFVEGISASVADVVLAEDDLQRHPPGSPTAPSAAGEVAANLTALAQAVDSARSEPLSVELLCRWHRLLMQGSPLPARYVGVVRDEQGWIGGTSPLDAALVTPPPEHLGALLADVVAFANRDDLDPVLQVAAAHAQLEVVHPFTDGNGRVGRLLISWLLARRLTLVVPPPVSTRIGTDIGGYLSGLTLWRHGQHEPWVRWVAGTVTSAGRVQRALGAELDALRARWQQTLLDPRAGGRRLRSDALAWQALDLLPRRLVLTAAALAAETGHTPRAAQDALTVLVDAGILLRYDGRAPRGRGRPPARFVCPELLGLSGATPLPRGGVRGASA